MPNYSVRNLTTNRLELHFERDFYLALAEPIKQRIRQSFYFDKRIPAWLSKTKLSEGEPSVPDHLGLEDYGTTGEGSATSGTSAVPRTERVPREPRTQTAKLTLNQHLKANALICEYEQHTGHLYKSVTTFLRGSDVVVKIVGKQSHYGAYSSDENFVQWFGVSKSGKVNDLRYTGSVDESKLTPVIVPAKVIVPETKRSPHYKLDNYRTELEHYTNFRGQADTRPKYIKEDVRADVLEIEVLLQKMEVNQYQRFDGMTDGYDRLEDNWKLMPLGLNIGNSHRKPYHSKANVVHWDDYELRYTGKLCPKVITFPRRGMTDTAVTKPNKPVDTGKLSAAFFKTADSLQTESDRKNRELETALSNTPKRLREYNSKQIDADIAADKAKYYRAIGNAIAAGNLPGSLSGIRPARASDDLYLFLVPQSTGGGYYDAYRAEKPRFQQLLAYPSGEATVLKYATPINLRNVAAVEQAYSDLQRITGGVSVDPSAHKLKQLIDKWKFTNVAGFFPTPDGLADELIEDADIRPGETVYEPSAGLGDLAERIRKAHPANPLFVGETMYGLREILQLKDFTVVSEDFLQTSPPADRYDVIVMNPPFENGQDIDHVRHAYLLLKAGGRVVSILGEGAFHGNQRKSREFLDWLNHVGASVEKLPANSFKSAFRSTGVSTRKVLIRKPLLPVATGPNRPQYADIATAQQQAKAKLKLLGLKLKLLQL